MWLITTCWMITRDEAPRLALVAGVVMIGLDIYFKNRGAETPRQYVILLGETIIKAWETLQDAPVMTTP
jgi:hypothetical protein